MSFSKSLLTAFSLLGGGSLATASLTHDDSGCDPLVPHYCMLPFPNDFWRVEDSSGTGATGGFHLNFSTSTFPADDHGKVSVCLSE